jgi:hypothetical protein
MVAARWRRLGFGTTAIACLLSGISACSSFDPAKERRYKLLHAGDDRELQISGAYWRAYDDQHSSTFACTNGAAGNHAPNECSHLDIPHFDWDGPKCLEARGDLTDGNIAPRADGSICLQGLLAGVAPCADPNPDRCIDSGDDGDLSNIWGAGFGLVFNSNEGWNADEHRVRGVAFDLSPQDLKLGGSDLNLRVQIPIVLDDDTKVPFTRPLIRDDGTVLGKDGKIYDCDSKPRPTMPEPRMETTLRAARVIESGHVTSELHPSGSPFWQLADAEDWGPSPLDVGHNEFEWDDVKPPPERLPGADDEPVYSFRSDRILGVHFQVARPRKTNQEAVGFNFCIENLAFLLDE